MHLFFREEISVHTEIELLCRSGNDADTGGGVGTLGEPLFGGMALNVRPGPVIRNTEVSLVM